MPGLRREEVAQLAGVSVDYYVRLERGRNLNVSESVLDALARALQLNDVERGHLFTVARPRRGQSRSPSRPFAPRWVRTGMRQVLSALTGVPALVLGRRLDVLDSNHLARALYTDFEAVPHRERNMARFVFLDEPRASCTWTGPTRRAASSPPCTCTPAATRTIPSWPS